MMTGRLKVLILSAVLAAASSTSGAGESNIQVEGAWSRRAPMMQSGDSKIGSGNGVIYATLANPGKEADALIAAASDAAGAVEIHESYRDMGMVMMRPVKKIEIPAGKKVEMKPGGYHIMLLNLKRDLKAGEVVNVTLQFDKAGKIPVQAVIK